MTFNKSTARSSNRRGPVRLVFVAAVAVLVYESYRTLIVVVDMFDRLANRASGLTLTWNPGFPASQPDHAHFSGGPFISPGTTAYFTAMTGTVKNVPVNTIVLESLGELAGVLATGGVAVGILLLARKSLAGVPFAKTSARLLTIMAIIVFVGFEGANFLQGLGDALLPTVLFKTPAFPDGTFEASGNLVALLTPWPLFTAFALLALAAIFRTGGRFQEDSSGLV
jgi:hypothetical protein